MTAVEVPVPLVLNLDGIRQWRAALERAFAPNAAPVVVLRASQAAFCRGMDLGDACNVQAVEAAAPAFADCLERIRLGPKPVVAAVEGPTTAGGVGIVAAADLVIACPAATFGLTELLFGLLPAIILPYLAERVGLSRARMWALTTGSWSSAEAQSAGLVDVLAPACLDRPLRVWTRRLSRALPAVVGPWKRYTAESQALDPRRGVTVTLDRLRDPAVLETIRQFLADEEPVWMRNA